MLNGRVAPGDTVAIVGAVRLVAARQIEAGRFVTHRFDLDNILEAYDAFARAADTSAIKVVMTRS